LSTKGPDSPVNLETPASQLRAVITPTESFFTRSHFPIPKVNVSSWRLTVDGEVRKPLRLSYSALKKMPQRAVAVTLECAGNGRKGFGIVASGEVPWGNRAVGTALWSGVPLSDLLAASAFSPEAKQVVVEGEDEGRDPVSGERIHFARGLPIEKALDRDCLVALSMNSKTLPIVHGFPARLIVPGWYGMASVKWLSRISISSDAAFNGYFSSVKYNYVTGRKVVPVTQLRVKSLLISPREHQILKRSKPTLISGKAWSGGGPITRVEVSINGVWTDAKFTQPLGPNGWATWKLRWIPDELGRNVISARATDSSTNFQPSQPRQNRYQYGFNAVQEVEVNVTK